MKRHLIPTSPNERKRPKHCNVQIISSSFIDNIDIDNIELTLSIPQQSDLDYIEQNSLIITKSIDAEAIYAVENGGSYKDEDDDIHIPLILLHNKEIVSYMQMTISSMANDATIDWLATAPAAQGNGFAKLFLLTVLKVIKSYGIEQINLVSSEEGLPLYVKCGFLPANKELLVFLQRGQSLFDSITHMEHFIANRSDVNLELYMAFSDAHCKTTLQNYLAENSTMLAKINYEPQVQTLIQNACAIEPTGGPSLSHASGEEHTRSPSLQLSLVKTFFTQEEMKEIGLSLERMPTP
ncbi:GNAT family N-acetyltransferase [Legionella rowbothamii]|uniref:GNAT family N-acetyltransferase n=1 Tax=Legionella rowbothamii TaxID=96229 RepID=UPI001056A08F|nr:GNAT family N-acetyltransferase [Legionella rowbothamii]